MTTVKFKKLSPLAVIPTRGSAKAAGLDLSACFPTKDDVIELHPGQRALVRTGLAMTLPEGHEGQIRPRSGLAFKNGLTVLNSPGTVDEDYRGEVKVLLINLGSVPFTIRHGDRIAQLVVAPVAYTGTVEVEDLDSTQRGESGFGSSGVR